MTDNSILITRLEKHIRSRKVLLPAQEEAVFSNAPLTLVGAGAGTGKTHTLSWRYLRALLRDGMRPRDILTLTFTEKAASEMAERITFLFSELRPMLDPDGTMLQTIAEELQEASVSTIHSFALNILREEALFLPAGLAARPMSPPEEELFTSRTADALDTMNYQWFRNSLPEGSTLEEFLDPEPGDPADVLNTYGPNAVVSFALSLTNVLESRGESPESLLVRAEDPEYFDAAAQRLKDICLPLAKDLADLWLRTVLPSLPVKLPGTGAFNERLEGFRRTWNSPRPQEKEEESLFHFLSDYENAIIGDLRGVTMSKTGKLLADILGESLSEQKERLAYLLNGVKFLRTGAGAVDFRLRRTLLRIAALVWTCFREFRRRRGVLSFDDMIRLAREGALPGDASRQVRTYKEILVDEFQDTNPLQNALIRSVAEKGGRIFLVGDLKQSIYRFRHADPALFGNLILQKSEDTRYIPLQINFRTRSSLLAIINGFFGEIWKNGLSSTLRQKYEDLLFPDDGEMKASRENSTIPPLIPIIRFAREGENIAATRRRAACALAEKLLALRGQPVWDKKQRAMRPAEWRDMTILVPSRTSFKALQEVFHPVYGIPTAFEKGKRYFVRGEIGDLLAAIRAIAFPGDESALLSFLFSPFSGLSLEECAPLLADRGASFESAHPAAAARLKVLQINARYRGLFQALCEMLRNQVFLLHYPEWIRREVLANLWKALDMVREYESIFGRDPTGCASYFAAMASRQGSGEESTPLGEDEDVVRVITAHSSKGLEFPIVAVMDLNNVPGGKGGGGESLVHSLLLGAGTSFYPKEWVGDNNRSETGKLAAFLEKTETEEEWQRLFYVSCTRAMDCLILCSPCGTKNGRPAPKKGSWLSFLGQDALPCPGNEPEDTSPPKQSSSSKTREEQKTGPRVRKPSLENLRFERLSATSYAIFAWCPAAWRMKFRQGIELVWELPSSENEGGADLGSLAHWVLARWNFLPSGLDPLLAYQIPPNLPPNLRTVWREKKNKAALFRWLMALAERPVGKRLARITSMGILQREIPFRFTLEKGPLLTGTMDALWMEEDRIFIRDYKITAREDSLETKENSSWEFLYEAQLRFYGYAARLAFPSAGPDIRLIHLRTGEEGKAILPESSWDTVEDDIRETARRAAQGPFSPALHRCRECFYRMDCPFRGNR